MVMSADKDKVAVSLTGLVDLTSGLMFSRMVCQPTITTEINISSSTPDTHVAEHKNNHDV